MAPEDEVYARIGEEGFARLVAAFYRRVPADDLLGPMYPRHDLTGAEQRLCDFLVGRFGGPSATSPGVATRGCACATCPSPSTPAARDRWVALMDAALAEAALEPDSAATLRAFFADTATFLINRE
jgi:hemoglobin